MSENERKYEVLPGVKLPDLNTIRAAASDFSVSGVDDFEIKAQHRIMPDGTPDAATSDELKRLQNLGAEVAAAEAKAMAESQKKMNSILESAVTEVSLDDLKETAEKTLSEERKAEIEKIKAEEEAARAEEEAKNKAREERRLMQQQALEESLARKAAKAEEEARIEAEKKAKLAAEEKERLKKERLEAQKNHSDNKAKSEADDEYKAWVKAKREAAIAEAAEKKAKEQKNAPQEIKQEEPKTEKVEEKTTPAVTVTPKKNDDGEGNGEGSGISSDEQTMEDFGEFL